MQNIKTMKKQISFILICAILAAMLMPLFAIEVQAATAGNFTIAGGDEGTDYNLDTSVTGEETLTVLTSNVGTVAFNQSSGKVGHVILDNGVAIADIDTNGDVTVNGTAIGSVITNGDVTVNGAVGVNVQTDGNITVNSSGAVNGTVITRTGTLNVAAGGRVGSVDISNTVSIDGTNLTVQNSAGSYSVPLSVISSDGTITIRGDLTLSGNITQQIIIRNTKVAKKTITVQSDTTLSHASGLYIENTVETDIKINSGTLTVSNGIFLSIQYAEQNITINGNIAGDILANDPTAQKVRLNYESGTLTGKIELDNVGNTVEIGTGATITGGISTYGDVTVNGAVSGNVFAINGTADISGMVNGNVSANGSITVSGTINGDASAVAGTINLTPTGMVTGSMTPVPSSNVVIDNPAGGTSVNLIYNQYYPITTADTVGTPQSAAPTTGGYIRLTTGGAKNILEVNNIYTHIGHQYIIADGSGLPLEIYAVGAENRLLGISHDMDITMTAASGGELVSNINTTGTFTLQSGSLRAFADIAGLRPVVVINGINAADIIINGGELLAIGATVSAGGTTYEPALSVKPTINLPSGMTARIMTATNSLNATPVEVAESTDYHLSNVVQISFEAIPVPTPVPTNPAISPATGVYNK